MAALKGWAPSAPEPLPSVGFADGSCRPQADVCGSDQHFQGFSQDQLPSPRKNQSRLHGPLRAPCHSKSLGWATVDFRAKTNAVGHIPTAAVGGWLQTPASMTFGWHPQCPVAIKAGNFPQAHVSTPPPNVTLIPISWYPFPCFLSFPKFLCQVLLPQSTLPQNYGEEKRTKMLKSSNFLKGYIIEWIKIRCSGSAKAVLMECLLCRDQRLSLSGWCD